MRLVVFVALLLAGGGCSPEMESPAPDLARTWSNPSWGACPGPVASDGELGCRLDTPLHCVCGYAVYADSGAGSEGSCGGGVCCKGCWNVDTGTCLPGNDARGWGSFGEACRSTPQRATR